MFLDDPITTDDNPSNTVLNKVNSSEFDPLQDKNQHKNGTEEHKEPPKPASTPQQQQPTSEPNSRPQSVAMAGPGSHPPQTVASTNHSNHVDYFNRTTMGGNYPQMQYGTPYPSQFNYPSG